ncbi:DUF3644 domain-containing protein [Leptolyngbya sp. 15MV]|nr:DUF3644 domain-containing protein [Leptolyngbya sp. 15MV]
MRPARWKALVDKSIAACCAAIEIYNKPVVPHREETFAILVVAAWELLLKARLIQENGNQLKAIYETEPVKRKDGKQGKRWAVRRNKAGNPITIGISTAIDRAKALPAKPLDTACKENLELLVEVRNNAVHFMNEDRDLAIRVHEVGVAALRNYATALADWFEHDISTLRFAILPLSFDGAVAAQVVPAAKRSQQAQNLLAHMERAISSAVAPTDGRFAVSLRVETRIVGNRASDAVPIKHGRGPDAAKVELTEEALRQGWPHDYEELVRRVKKRVPGVKQNAAFHAAHRALSSDGRLARVRLLDINNPKSSKKTYYSDAMVDALATRLRTGAPATIGS